MAVTINLNNVQGAATARTAAQWVSDNPVIPANYVGFETDTGKYKLGDGVTAWNSLSYPSFGGGGIAWGAITGTLSSQTDLQSALDAKITANSPITGATKTKVTYDANGLVTAGADAAIADITGLQTALDAKQNTLTNPITGTGTSGQVSFFNGTTTQTGDNGLFWDNTNKRLGIGTNSPNSLLHITGSNTASGGTARGLNLTPTLIAAANNDVLYALDISPTFTNGAFTGVANRGIVSIVDTNSVYAGVLIRNSSNGTSAFSSITVANDIASASFQITGSGNTIANVTPNQARFRTDSGISNGFNFITGNASAPISFSIGDITRMRIFGSTGNLIIQSGGTFTDAGAKLQLQTGAVGTIGQIIQAAAGQTANLWQLRSSAAAVMTHFTDNGAWSPASLADANAANSTVYYSTTQSKLVFKDSAGVVNDLY